MPPRRRAGPIPGGVGAVPGRQWPAAGQLEEHLQRSRFRSRLGSARSPRLSRSGVAGPLLARLHPPPYYETHRLAFLMTRPLTRFFPFAWPLLLGVAVLLAACASAGKV